MPIAVYIYVLEPSAVTRNGSSAIEVGRNHKNIFRMMIALPHAERDPVICGRIYEPVAPADGCRL